METASFCLGEVAEYTETVSTLEIEQIVNTLNQKLAGIEAAASFQVSDAALKFGYIHFQVQQEFALDYAIRTVKSFRSFSKFCLASSMILLLIKGKFGDSTLLMASVMITTMIGMGTTICLWNNHRILLDKARLYGKCKWILDAAIRQT